MINEPVVRISPSDLNRLMTNLEVRFAALTECLVSAGYCLELGGTDAPGLHYNIKGSGRMLVKGAEPIELTPHTLVIVPPKHPFRLEAIDAQHNQPALRSVDGALASVVKGEIRHIVAGEGEPEIVLVCGFFDATYGSAIDLFGNLTTPIVEQFSESDGLDVTLRTAVAELVAQEIGSAAVSAVLLKFVILHVLRRSLHSRNVWVERFSLLRDPHIARAFAEMAAEPGRAHNVSSLAQIAHLSRSAFMARFVEVVGHPPMSILRDLRMRLAAEQLRTGLLSVDQVVRNTGYGSRSSFTKAFKKVFGKDPADYRATAASG